MVLVRFFFFGLGLGPLAYVTGAEISSSKLRKKVSGVCSSRYMGLKSLTDYFARLFNLSLSSPSYPTLCRLIY